MDSEKKKEQQRVDYVIGRIKEKIETTGNELEKARKETSSVEKNYVQNTKINTFEVDDRMETNAEVQQQKQLVAKNVENERILKQELSKLTLLKDSPYFGRIDILDQGEEEPESLYIGTASFAENNRNFLVYDWRAPISSIFTTARSETFSMKRQWGYRQPNSSKKDSSRSSTAKSDTCLIPTKPSATKCCRPF